MSLMNKVREKWDYLRPFGESGHLDLHRCRQAHANLWNRCLGTKSGTSNANPQTTKCKKIVDKFAIYLQIVFLSPDPSANNDFNMIHSETDLDGILQFITELKIFIIAKNYQRKKHRDLMKYPRFSRKIGLSHQSIYCNTFLICRFSCLTFKVLSFSSIIEQYLYHAISPNYQKLYFTTASTLLLKYYLFLATWFDESSIYCN